MNFLDQFSLEGKTALVTGSNTGLGQAMAIGLAEAGADIVGVSSKDGGDTESIIAGMGRKFTGYQADLSGRAVLYEFITKVRAGHSIDILVNNAGMILRKPAAERTSGRMLG